MRTVKEILSRCKCSAEVLFLAAILVIGYFVFSATASGQEPQGEVEWVAEIAKSLPFAEVEVRLPNGRRCDIVWGGYACEADWAEGLKPFEGIGQALHYSDWLDLKPAVLLLVRKESEAAISDCKLTCKLHGIELWVFDTRTGKWLTGKPSMTFEYTHAETKKRE